MRGFKQNNGRLELKLRPAAVDTRLYSGIDVTQLFWIVITIQSLEEYTVLLLALLDGKIILFSAEIPLIAFLRWLAYSYQP